MNENKEIKILTEAQKKKQIANQKYREKNKEFLKEYNKIKSKEFYENNKEAILFRNKIYKKEWYKNKCSEMDDILFNDISNKLQNTL
jgi:hypothetical protein